MHMQRVHFLGHAWRAAWVAGPAAADAAEEGAFADVVAELMQERIDAPEAVRGFAAACRDQAAALR
jgi:hypothetical protein